MSHYPHLDALIQTMATLRGQNGCQWDREQDHNSLVSYLIEEVHELVDAIESDDRTGMREELGDVLYQVLFHTDIARVDEEDPFDIDDVARLVNEKMRRRHPHVFEGVQVGGVDDIKDNWQKIKSAEKSDRRSVLDGVPQSLTGLARADAVMTRAARIDQAPEATDPLPPTDSSAWGRWLLHQIDQARSRGINVDQALRGALREFEQRVAEAEKAQ
jgi:XTP/dITP diphosphohydrolase